MRGRKAKKPDKVSTKVALMRDVRGVPFSNKFLKFVLVMAKQYSNILKRNIFYPLFS